MTARERRAGGLAALDELLGRRVSMRSLALLGCWPARRCCSPPLQPFLSDALDGRIYSDAFYEPYAAWYPELPRGALRRLAAARGGGRGRHVARPGDARGDGDDVRDRHLQPLPLDHALPQQPGLPRDRARAAGGGAARRRQRAGLAAVAAAVRVLGGLRGVRAEQAPRSRLVRRHGHLAARRAGAGGPGALAAARLGGVAPHRPRLPHRGGQADRAHRAVHRGRAVVARHPLRGGLGRRRLPPGDRGVGLGAGLLVPRDRRARGLGGALHPRPGAPHRPAPRRASGAWARWCAGSTGWHGFRVEPRPGLARLELVDRDGTTLRGAPAVALALSRLPLTAWFALPALLYPPCAARDDRPRTGRPGPRAHRGVRVRRGGARSTARRSRSPELRGAAQASVDWFVRNQKFGGDWLYEYNADTDTTAAEYNPSATPASRWASTRRPAAGLPARSVPPTAARSGRSSGSSSATAGPLSPRSRRWTRARPHSSWRG